MPPCALASGLFVCAYDQEMTMSFATESASDWITIGRAAARLGVSVPTVRNLVRDGKLSVRTLGHWTRVRASEVEALDRESTKMAVATG
jgi:excisionase family DNA binding protein